MADQEHDHEARVDEIVRRNRVAYDAACEKSGTRLCQGCWSLGLLTGSIIDLQMAVEEDPSTAFDSLAMIMLLQQASDAILADHTGKGSTSHEI